MYKWGILIFLVTFCKCDGDPPIIKTKNGDVLGIINISRNGRPYYAFKGIPYAKPPLGGLRFKSPEEADNWKGIYNAQNSAPHCIQKNYLFSTSPSVEGSEDCLYLNVFTPKLNIKEDTLLPVMVFIHWGGFFAGYSSTDYLGPEYIMDKNVILVTFNYRLGVMGFLSTNDDVSPGNYGLKDQVAVLKWVQANIENFGGNKDNVTIFGQSAGAASVHFHMMSPLSKSLFQRAISESGTGLALWAKPMGKEQEIILHTVASVNCPNTVSNKDIVDCLRNITAESLIKSFDKLKFFSIDPLNIFMPSIEKLTEQNPHPFLTKTPQEYIRNREFKNVPWIVGVVKDEGLIRAEPILRQPLVRTKLNASFDSLMPKLMALELSTDEKHTGRIWNEIKGYYFKGKSILNVADQKDVQALIDLYTDRSFLYSTYQSVLYHKLNKHEKIWFYNFNYKGEQSYGNLFAATEKDINYNWGVSHCDELMYLFKTPALFPELNNTNDDYMITKMVELWTNFAQYGDPTPKNISKEKWEKLDTFDYRKSKNLKYLNIEGSYNNPPKFNMEKGLCKTRLKFWESLILYENIAELNQKTVNNFI